MKKKNEKTIEMKEMINPNIEISEAE